MNPILLVSLGCLVISAVAFVAAIVVLSHAKFTRSAARIELRYAQSSLRSAKRHERESQDRLERMQRLSDESENSRREFWEKVNQITEEMIVSSVKDEVTDDAV